VRRRADRGEVFSPVAIGPIVLALSFAIAIPTASASPSPLAAVPGAKAPAFSPARAAFVRTLVRAGTPELAWTVLRREEPSRAHPRAWSLWARLSVRLLTRLGRPRRILALLSAPPPGVSVGVDAWIVRARARAFLALGATRSARALLRVWLWTNPPVVADLGLGRVRRLIVRSYVEARLWNDAALALRRLREDDPHLGVRWRMLEARVDLARGRPRRAFAILETLPGWRTDPGALTAALRARALGPRRVLAAAHAIALDRRRSVRRRLAAWILVARVEGSLAHPGREIAAWESAVELAYRRDRLALLPHDVGPLLWRLEKRRGLALANAHGLVVGLNGPWFALAHAEMLAGHHARARALWSALALESRGRARARAFADLARSLQSRPGLPEVLFLAAPTVVPLAALPPVVRYGLVRPVLALGADRLAARLLHGLVRPPKGVGPWRWELTRLRLYVDGDAIGSARRLLGALLARCPCPHRARFERVGFALGTLHHWRLAARLFAVLARTAKTPEEARHALYWEARDVERLGDPLAAARLYMRSAVLLDPFALDPWAQTARYHAARALARAGLFADARRQYEEILAATKSPAERALLRHALSDLRLEEERRCGRTTHDARCPGRRRPVPRVHGGSSPPSG